MGGCRPPTAMLSVAAVGKQYLQSRVAVVRNGIKLEKDRLIGHREVRGW